MPKITKQTTKKKTTKPRTVSGSSIFDRVTEIDVDDKVKIKGKNTVFGYLCRVSFANRDKCWEWKGTIQPGEGYGIFWWDGKSMGAHRFMMGKILGETIEDLCVCHHCDNPSCVNPLHLFVGHQFDNMSDKTEKGRQALGSGHGMLRLNEEKVRTLRRLHSKGVTARELSRRFGTSPANIGYMVSRQTWRHV